MSTACRAFMRARTPSWSGPARRRSQASLRGLLVQAGAPLPCPVVAGGSAKTPEAPQPPAKVHCRVADIRRKPKGRLGNLHGRSNPRTLGHRPCTSGSARHSTLHMQGILIRCIARRLSGTSRVAPSAVASDSPQDCKDAGLAFRPPLPVTSDLWNRAEGTSCWASQHVAAGPPAGTCSN